MRSMGNPAIKRTYELYTYDDVWEDAKKRLKIIDEELRKAVESGLQMWAWADIMEGTIDYVIAMRNPLSDLKRLLEQVDKRNANQ